MVRHKGGSQLLRRRRFANYAIDGSVEALEVDDQGLLWVGTGDGQLYRREGPSFVPVRELADGGINGHCRR